MHKVFEHFQEWWLCHFLGQSLPTLYNPSNEKNFPHISSKPLLMQLEAVSSFPITCYLREGANLHLTTGRPCPTFSQSHPMSHQPTEVSSASSQVGTQFRDSDKGTPCPDTLPDDFCTSRCQQQERLGLRASYWEKWVSELHCWRDPPCVDLDL